MRQKTLFIVISVILFWSIALFVLAEEQAGTDFVQEMPQQAAPNVAETQKIPSNQNKLSLDIKGMDIIDVLKMLSSRSGMNIIVGKNVSGRVTLFLKDVDIWEAFEIIISANELAYEKKDSIINVMTQRDYELLYGERFQSKKQAAKTIHLKYSKAIDLSKSLNQMKTNIGKVVVDESSNTLILSDTLDKMKEMEDFISQVDLPIQTKVFSLNYAVADKISPKIQEILTKGVGTMKIDERTNKIVITDYPQKVVEIGEIISAFDEKTPQVVIDAQIVEISPQKDEFSMGVDWDYWLKKNMRLVSAFSAPSLASATTMPGKLAFGVASTNPDSSSVSSKGEYKSLIEALRIIGETKILSSPRIMVLNNQEAKILVGTKEPYITSTTSQSGSGSTVTSQSVTFVDVGIKLYVTPTINRDGFVTIKVRPEISSSTRDEITSEGQITQVPIVSTSETETTIMVKDGATIIIAGLKKDKQVKEVKKFPVIGDIPFLGVFFKSQKEEKTKTELVIFITPHIVSGEESLEYNSLTQDKDIISLEAQARSKNKKEGSSLYEYYKEIVYDRVKTFVLLSRGRLKGAVDISFVLNSTGRLKNNPEILFSSDDKLNNLAVKCVKDASPFAIFPKELNKKEETFNMTLNFE